MNEVPYELYLAFSAATDIPVYYDVAPVTAENDCIAFVAAGGEAPERGAGTLGLKIYARSLTADGLSEVWAEIREMLKVFDEACDVGGVHITRTRAGMPSFDGVDQQGRIYEVVEVELGYHT